MEPRLPEVAYPPTVPSLLHRAAQLYGDDDFVVLREGRLSFREAERRSRDLAMRLLAHGVGKGTRVGIILPTGIEWAVVWLAAARIGALSMLFPATYRPAELRRALAFGDVAVLLAQRRLFDRDYERFLEEAIPSLTEHRTGPIYDLRAPFLRSIWMVSGSDRSWAYSPPSGYNEESNETGGPIGTSEFLTAVESHVSPADPLVVIFTSGTTADPKGVIHTHGSAIRKIQPDLGMGLAPSNPGRHFCATPFFWVGGPQSLLGALHSGATVVTQPRFDPVEALELLEREQCTSIVGWANMLDRLSNDPTYGHRKLAGLSVAQRQFSSRGHPRNLGMTETFGPHANREWFDYRVVDPQTGRAMADGEEGEFWVRGFGLMAGMYKTEREATFDADGWYHTGDRGYVENGTIWFTGRSSEMIKSSGANVSPVEVEQVLQSFSDVSMAFVLGIPDPDRGQAVAAVVVPAIGVHLNTEQLRERANRELSAYKVPAHWHVLEADAVPWLPTGKPDKRSLAALF